MPQALQITGNVTPAIVGFQGDLASKQAAFIVALSGPGGENLGQVHVAILPHEQPDSVSNEKIPGWDEYLKTSPKAQAAFAAIRELGYELAAYSKLLDVVEVAEDAADVVDEVTDPVE